MPINKSQGLMLDIVGLYLPKPVLSPGQLYMVVSRVQFVEGLHILLGNSRNRTQAVTRNIVFHEIFEDLRQCFLEEIVNRRNVTGAILLYFGGCFGVGFWVCACTILLFFGCCF
ncbi:hypothetical protein LINGRAHAP2_LOCUS8424 [Linum grandiflorum]